MAYKFIEHEKNSAGLGINDNYHRASTLNITTNEINERKSKMDGSGT